MISFRSKQANSAIIGMYHLLLTVFILAGLYFGQEIVIPLFIAILLTFLLSSLVTKLERWIGRIPSVLVIVVSIFFCLSELGHVLSVELADLVSQLPSYKGNIETKLQSIQFLHNNFFTQIWHEVENLPKSMIPQKVIESSGSITQTAQTVLGSIIHLSVNIGFVLLLVIFMLISREDLKSRIIRLIGQGNIRNTTLAMDDAGTRISHYLSMQLLINFCFGTALAVGLHIIGIPNAVLWGTVLIFLRFVPYIGTWIAAAVPVALSLVISAHWMAPLFTIGLYLVLDLITTNFLEPWLYGATTGISSTALIIAAVFWTLLWGPIGLLLSIPLTVCLVVMGDHVPQLEFLRILLGDDKVLEAHEEFYHRLLTQGSHEGLALTETYLKENSLISFYDSVLIPLLGNIQNDLNSETLEPENAQHLYQNIHEIIEEQNQKPSSLSTAEAEKNGRVLCLSAKNLQDELASEMLMQVLQEQSFFVESASVDSQDLNFINQDAINFICIQVVDSSTMFKARHICKKLREHDLKSKIIVSLLGDNKITVGTEEKLRASGADAVATSLTGVIDELRNVSL